jgi:hypothetical protein
MISKLTNDFVGREWIFSEIDQWLSDPDGQRYFLLSGKVGTGKSTIAARLIQFSEGSAPFQENMKCIKKDFLHAFHICSEREQRWQDPLGFSGSLSFQHQE